MQVILDLLVITGLVYLTGGPGIRAGFMLLYPISVLSGSVLLYRRKSLLLAGVATLFYAAMLWAVRDGWIPAPGPLRRAGLPVKHVLYSIFVTGRGLRDRRRSSAPTWRRACESVGQKLEEAAEQVADLRELNQVVVSSIHSGLITADLGGPHPAT